MRQTKLYRLFEILPAFLAWATIILMVLFSFYLPAYTAIFIILFDLYWLLKTVYFSLHLKSSFAFLKKNLKTNWMEKLESDERILNKWKEIYHLIILPMYNEPLSVVRETFNRLSESRYPLNRFIIVLATEERAGSEAQEVADMISKEFGGHFFKFIKTIHPKNLPNEIPGKGSNQAYAGAIAKKEIIDKLCINYEKIIASVFDVDTQIYKDYFGILTYKFLTTENAAHSSYQPVPFFLNNIYQAPALARIIGFSATFWHLMQQSRPEKLTTFSSHSMPFKALVEIGFWQRDMVSEDSRIFWQLYIHYNGNWKVTPLFYPVSMDANVANTFWQTMINIYKQQRRWAFGSENIAYMLYGFVKNKSISIFKKIKWSFFIIEGFHSWSTSSLIIFALGWMPVLFGGAVFKTTMLAYNLPQITRYIMTVASIGIVSSAILSMTLLPSRPLNLKKFNYVWYFLSWILMPLTLIFFGSIPSLEAQTRLAVSGKWRLGFWVTPKRR